VNNALRLLLLSKKNVILEILEQLLKRWNDLDCSYLFTILGVNWLLHAYMYIHTCQIKQNVILDKFWILKRYFFRNGGSITFTTPYACRRHQGLIRADFWQSAPCSCTKQQATPSWDLHQPDMENLTTSSPETCSSWRIMRPPGPLDMKNCPEIVGPKWWHLAL
jgi:hypothetical protein